jgi:hypothetical protein
MVREACGTIDDVIARMRAIDAELPAEDGVAQFNRLYLRVTEEVLAAVVTASFEDAAFLDRLDVVFAGLYFAAYDADAAGETVPAAWRPLFAHRHRAHRMPLQFAMAGMNAHINHDLPFAVVSTCAEMGLTPSDGSPQHRDYQAVNRLLGEVEVRVKAAYLSGAMKALDLHAGHIDDAWAMGGIHLARSAAWHRALRLWTLRRHPKLYEEYLHVMAAEVDLAGRALVAL